MRCQRALLSNNKGRVSGQSLLRLTTKGAAAAIAFTLVWAAPATVAAQNAFPPGRIARPSLPGAHPTGEFVGYSVPVATDSTAYCTFADDAARPLDLVPADASGAALRPTTNDITTPTLQVTIFIKASQAVLDSSQTGEPLEGQTVKLVLRDKPTVAQTTAQKAANDQGFKDPAVQCTTDANGQCSINVAQQDLPLYGTPPQSRGAPVSRFALSFNLMKHDGGVAEVTGRPLPDLRPSLAAGNFRAEPVKIGNRTFVRIGLNTPYGSTGDLHNTFSKLLGVPVQVDICIVKEPGPPLGSEPTTFGALNHELPQASLRLTSAHRAGGR
jgi:hypothetical protein